MTPKLLLSPFLKRRRGTVPAFRRPGDARDAYDVVIVGGGVCALAVARATAAAGAATALLAPDEIAASADERAWPVLRFARADRLRSASDAEAGRILRRLARDFSAPAAAERAGALTIAGSRDELERLSDAAGWLKAEGAQAWMVPGREVAALSPPLGGAGEPPAALYEPGALTVDADALAMGLAEAAAAQGAELFAAAPVTALARDGAGTSGVMVGERLIRAPAIVLADDLAAIRLIREGNGRLSLTRSERMTLVTAAGAPATGPALAAGDLLVSRDRTGALVVYGPRGADDLARRVLDIAPALAGLEVVAHALVTAWAGVDGLPQVGAAGTPAIWLALGFGLDALSLALPAAECLAAQIAGRPGPRAFEPFAPTRRPGVRAPEAA